jgi:HEAT repeat protein
VLALVFARTPEIGAQDRSALTRVLLRGDDFRIRVQAAFALGATNDPSVVPSLERALRDTEPAVRAAAATALGRIGAPRALPALEAARNDSSATRSGSLRTRAASVPRSRSVPRRKRSSGRAFATW